MNGHRRRQGALRPEPSTRLFACHLNEALRIAESSISVPQRWKTEAIGTVADVKDQEVAIMAGEAQNEKQNSAERMKEKREQERAERENSSVEKRRD